MKVLITAPSLDENENVSGISSVVRQIVARAAGTEFVHFTAGRRDGRKTGPVWLFDQAGLLPRFRASLKKNRPDIVHINTALTPLSILRDAALTFVAERMGFPVLLHIHGGRFLTEGFSRPVFARLTRRMIDSSEVVVVLSRGEKKLIEDFADPEDVRVLENAVPFDEIDSKAAPKNEEKNLIFIGRFHKGKGLKEIVETVRTLKKEGFEFRFTCYGAGEEKERFIREMTAILGEKFFYGGVIGGDEKWEALRAGDIFLLPTHYEGLPLSLLEAMAAGCIPLVSRVGSIGEVVEDGKNGFLTEPRDVAGIIEKLRFLLSDNDIWEDIRKNARATICERFDLAEYLVKLEGIYRKISQHQYRER
ncbi:MAG: glycosyltransferase family 4 protein [Pyrinomonadaceae bacterium]